MLLDVVSSARCFKKFCTMFQSTSGKKFCAMFQSTSGKMEFLKYCAFDILKLTGDFSFS